MSPIHSESKVRSLATINDIAIAILERVREVITWALVIGVAVASFLLLREREWRSTAAFSASDVEQGASGLRSLAGQFGFNIPGGQASQSPEFYREVARSRTLLGKVLRDSVTFDGAAQTILDVLVDSMPDPRLREHLAVEILRELLEVEASATTGIVRVAATTEDPGVSNAITSGVLREINTFAVEMRRKRAQDEMSFVQLRLDSARMELRREEAVLASFLSSNREYRNSPSLTFEHDRLQRSVALQQQVLSGLAQSFEEIRIRRARDIAQIVLVEPPSLPAAPEPGGRLFKTLAATTLGGLLGVLWVVLSTAVSNLMAADDELSRRFRLSLRNMAFWKR